jgi:hypothetical protein
MSGARLVRFAIRSARYLLAEASEHLPKARTLATASPLTITDGGDGGSLTLGLEPATATSLGSIKLAGQLGGSAASPDVRGLRSTGAEGVEGPQSLTMGHVGDGQVLSRSGGAIVGLSVLPSTGGALAGDLAMAGHKVTGLATGSSPDDAATYGQLTSLLNGLDWQEAVLDRTRSVPPSGPSSGDRHIIATGASGAWVDRSGQIAIWTGSAWSFVTPSQGMTVHVEEEGCDLCWNGSAWVNIGSSIDHGALLNLAVGNPHTQYQLTSEKGIEGGYPGLDALGRVAAPTKLIRTSAAPSPVSSGEVWIDGEELQFRGASEAPATQTVERLAHKDQGGGYAGLDSLGRVSAPVRQIRQSAAPSPVDPGEVWIDGADLQFRDAAGAPATQTVEVRANRNQIGGYAGLSATTGRLEAAQAAPRSVYATGGDQALSASDVGAAPASRTISAGTGLSGGGDLSANRSLDIASFTGIISKDIDPGSTSWGDHQIIIHLSLDVGVHGHLLPVGLRLPPTSNSSLNTEAVFTLDDNSTLTVVNASTGANRDENITGLLGFLAGDVSMAAANNGRKVQKITLQTRNLGVATVTADLGAFRIRAFALPRGVGAAL